MFTTIAASFTINWDNILKRIADYDRVIQLQPNDEAAYYNRGNTYNKLQQYPLALADYNRAIAINPKDLEAYYNRANVYHKTQQYQKAIADYSLIIKANPRHAPTYYNRGTTYLAAQNLERAIADYSQAVKLDPDYAEAYYNRAVAYNKSREYQRATRRSPKSDSSLSPTMLKLNGNLGLVYQTVGEKSLAVRNLQQAEKLFQQQNNQSLYNYVREKLQEITRLDELSL